MANAIGIGIETDPDVLSQEFDSYLDSYFPGVEFAAGSPMAVIRDAWAQASSELGYQVNETDSAIFRYFGPLAGIEPNDPVSATGTTTWTMVDSASYEIPAGTELDGVGTDGETVGLATIDTTTISGGSGTIEVQVVEPGEAGNDITGELTQVNAINGVVTVELDAATSGGSDGEADEDYEIRLSEILQLQSPSPILPDDFAIFVRTQIPEIYSATAIDLYDAEHDLENVERCCTTAVKDVDGEELSTEIMDEAQALLEAALMVNFLAFVIAPTYTTIDVNFTVTSLSDFDDDDVQSRAVSAVEEMLSPANFGVPNGGDPQVWVNTTVVRRYEIITALNNVEGVDYVGEVWIAKEGDTVGLLDIDLDGVAPLTRAGTVLNEAP